MERRGTIARGQFMRNWRMRMYPFLECLIGMVLVIVLGTGLYGAFTLALLSATGIRVFAKRSRGLIARARAKLPEKQGTSSLAPVVEQVDHAW
jgi:hypothetical protein